MSRNFTSLAIAAAVMLGGSAQAQQPGRPMGPPMGGPPNGAMIAPMGPGAGGGIASMLLAHTGEFKLSDVQVTRLAAIARRTTDRQRAMQASMDSMRTNVAAPANPGAEGRPVPSPAMRAMAERMREQQHAELRDAIAVLTPDQQAQGWEMMMSRGVGGGRGMGGAPSAMIRRQMMQRGARGRVGGPPAGGQPGQAQPQPRQPRQQRPPATGDVSR